jgi:hypothetical protein
MDNYSSFNEQQSAFDKFELQFTQQAQDYIKEIAKWATFLAIVGFIFIGFLVLGALGMFAMGATMSSLGNGGAMGPMGAMGMLGGAAMGVMFLLMAVFYFFPVLYLYNTERLTVAFQNLKSHYKFVGILTIIGMSFYALAIVVSIVGGVAAAAQ